MPELFLVRHGQASLGSDNYDQLSQLGHRQSRWLGEYFRARDGTFDRLIIGEMARHRQTAESICQGLGLDLEPETHPGFNEFDFAGLIRAYCAQHPQHAVTDWGNVRQLFAVLRLAMRAWHDERLEVPLAESWLDFHTRVADALAYARDNDKQRTLVASSGGAIAMALSQVMGFAGETLIDVNLQSKNTGINQFYYNANSIYVTSFNHVPHLDRPGRLDAITHR